MEEWGLRKEKKERYERESKGQKKKEEKADEVMDTWLYSIGLLLVYVGG